MKPRMIIIAGSIAQRVGYGGHVWVFVQYLLGFQRLGWDVLFLDAIDPSLCRDARGATCAPEESENLRWLESVMEQFGLGTSWSLTAGSTTFGIPRATVLDLARNAPLLINVMGFLADPEILALPKQRTFLDIDPGFGQMWRASGLADILAGYDSYLTIGENIGQTDCTIPRCGLDWITTPQPVVLEEWRISEGLPRDAFTTVASWRGPFGPIEFEGQTYGLRVHEFRKFIDLPKSSGERFDIALEIDPIETSDLQLLAIHGWNRLEPRSVAGTPDAYREFIRASKAELMVAKQMYVKTRGGWFSDRSICYLASGRPVLAQDTGFGCNYPVGCGLLSFATVEEAVEGAKVIYREYGVHARAARRLAEEYFDSNIVLSRLLEKLSLV